MKSGNKQYQLVVLSLLAFHSSFTMAQLPDTAAGNRMETLVICINNSNLQERKKERDSWMKMFFSDQSEEALGERDREFRQILETNGRLRFDQLLLYNHEERSITASFAAEYGNLLHISLKLTEGRSTRISDYEFKQVDMTGIGDFVDTAAIAHRSLEKQVQQLLEAVNSNDKEVIQTYIRDYTFPDFQKSDSMEHLTNLFLAMHWDSDELEYHSLREYESLTGGEIVVVCRNKKTNGWNAIFLRVQPTPRWHPDRIKYATVQAPK